MSTHHDGFRINPIKRPSLHTVCLQNTARRAHKRQERKKNRLLAQCYVSRIPFLRPPTHSPLTNLAESRGAGRRGSPPTHNTPVGAPPAKLDWWRKLGSVDDVMHVG